MNGSLLVLAATASLGVAPGGSQVALPESHEGYPGMASPIVSEYIPPTVGLKLPDPEVESAREEPAASQEWALSDSSTSTGSVGRVALVSLETATAGKPKNHHAPKLTPFERQCIRDELKRPSSSTTTNSKQTSLPFSISGQYFKPSRENTWTFKHVKVGLAHTGTRDFYGPDTARVQQSENCGLRVSYKVNTLLEGDKNRKGMPLGKFTVNSQTIRIPKRGTKPVTEGFGSITPSMPINLYKSGAPRENPKTGKPEGRMWATQVQPVYRTRSGKVVPTRQIRIYQTCRREAFSYLHQPKGVSCSWLN